ncbi:hypothetical protein Ancab_035015 [Ancistrocladus abbreviatus]
MEVLVCIFLSPPGDFCWDCDFMGKLGVVLGVGSFISHKPIFLEISLIKREKVAILVRGHVAVGEGSFCGSMNGGASLVFGEAGKAADPVATSRPSNSSSEPVLKCLRPVVSASTVDSVADVQPCRLQSVARIPGAMATMIKAAEEASPIMTWPCIARGVPFTSPRSMQWKRDSQPTSGEGAAASSNTTQSTPVRGLTYVGTESKADEKTTAA